jgi:hypothetical protein
MMRFITVLFFFFLSLTAFAQIPMRKGKAQEICGFVMFSSGVALPTQHFASAYGDFYYHNASGFAQAGRMGILDMGLTFPKENCEISLKTSYGSNPFDMDRYLRYLREPPSQVYEHPGGPGVTYTAVSSGLYKYVSLLLKVESEVAVKKFSFGLFCAGGTAKLLSFPDVKVAMDSASNHIIAGFSGGEHFGMTLNYGLSATYHCNSHLFVKMVADYLYSHYVFNIDYITAKENGNVWYTKEEAIHYAVPVTVINISLGVGYRF